jgi:hypothetical protein
MPAQLLALAVLAVAVVVAVRRTKARWSNAWRRLELAHLLAQPWYLWPVARVGIESWRQALHHELFEVCGFAEARQPTRIAARYISIRRKNGRPWIKVKVRRGFPEGDDEIDGKTCPKRLVEQQITQTTRVRWDFKWDFWFLRRHVIATPRQVVPRTAFARDSDVLDAIEAHLVDHRTAPPIALGRGDRLVAIDMDTEAPHLLISAGTIGGKSGTIRTLMAEMLWADPEAVGVIADKKEFSQRGLVHVPGVVYARSNEEINNALVAVWHEIERRNYECAQVGMGALPHFPRIVLGLEEVNVTYNQLNGWWRRHPDYDRKLAPGVYALDNILCCGRQAQVNCIVEGQDVNKRVISGSGAGTVNIAVRVLAEFDKPTWDRLAQGHEWRPPIPHKAQPGHCWVIHGSEIHEGQRIYFTDGEPDRKTGEPTPFEAYEWLKDRRAGRAWAAELLPQLALPRGSSRQDPTTDEQDQEHRAYRPSTQAQHSSSSEESRPRHRSGSGPKGTHDLTVGFDPSVQVVDGPTVLVDGASPTGVTEPRQSQPTQVGGGVLEHESRLSSPPTLPPVNTTVNPPGGRDRKENPEHPGVMGCDSNLDPNLTLRPPTNPPTPTSGFSVRSGGDASMLEIQSGSPSCPDDTEPNFRTLRELEGREWCPWRPGTLGRHARNPDLEFPEPVIKGRGQMPGRWSERAVREWVADYLDRGGEPGMYVVRQPGDDWSLVKIGETINLRGRLRRWNQYTAADPWRYVVLWIPCESKAAAQWLEALAHWEFDEYHEDLEFFRYGPRLQAWVERQRAEQEVRV